MHARVAVLVLALGCGKSTDAPKDAPKAKPKAVDAAPAQPIDAAPLETQSYDSLAAALTATIPADAKVIGFGELHQRTDREANIKSALARFTGDALPELSKKLSDLVIETWVVDTKCGKAAEVTAKVEMSMRRPQATRSEVGDLATAARKAKTQPHAMTITCDDYSKMAPGGNVDPEALLNLTTKELGRLVEETVKAPSKAVKDRPWIAVYGGALHNDRFPDKGVEDWSYARKADAATSDKFVEVDLIVPEFAAADPGSHRAPWFPLVESAAGQVVVWKRGDRSFVVVLPKS